MAPLFLPLLIALALAPGPTASADVLEGDSSGKRPHSGSLSLSPPSPLWKGMASLFVPPNRSSLGGPREEIGLGGAL